MSCFQPVQRDTAHMLLLLLEPIQMHTHHHMNPVPCLMLPELLPWKQMPVQVPAPWGSCLITRRPFKWAMSFFNLQKWIFKKKKNTTVPVYKFEIAIRTLGPWKFNSVFQLLKAILTAKLSIFSHFSHGMSSKGFILPRVFTASFFF